MKGICHAYAFAAAGCSRNGPERSEPNKLFVVSPLAPRSRIGTMFFYACLAVLLFNHEVSAGGGPACSECVTALCGGGLASCAQGCILGHCWDILRLEV